MGEGSLNPIPGRLFWTFERQGGVLFGPRHNAIKAVYIIEINWNLVQHIFWLQQNI